MSVIQDRNKNSCMIYHYLLILPESLYLCFKLRIKSNIQQNSVFDLWGWDTLGVPEVSVCRSAETSTRDDSCWERPETRSRPAWIMLEHSYLHFLSCSDSYSGIRTSAPHRTAPVCGKSRAVRLRIQAASLPFLHAHLFPLFSQQ